MKIRKRESGRSMIEMVGVLAITGLLTAGAFVLISSGMASQKRNRAADEIATIVQEMQSVDLKKVPKVEDYDSGIKLVEQMRLPLQTPFGSDTYYSVTSDGTYFFVHMLNIEKTDCQALERRAWSGNPEKVMCESDPCKYFCAVYKKNN